MGRLRLIAVCAVVAVVAAPASAAAAPGVARDARVCPAEATSGFKTKRLVGLSLARAERRAERNECSVRVVKRDGENLTVTSDYIANRINIAVVDDRVRRVLTVG